MSEQIFNFGKYQIELSKYPFGIGLNYKQSPEDQTLTFHLWRFNIYITRHKYKAARKKSKTGLEFGRQNKALAVHTHIQLQVFSNHLQGRPKKGIYKYWVIRRLRVG